LSLRLPARVARASLACALGVLAGCDVDITDIELDDTLADSGAADGRVLDAGPDVCTDGTFVCMDVPTSVVGNLNAPVDNALLSTVVDGHRFEARSVAGQARLTLPTDVPLWIRVDAPSYWPSEVATIAPRGANVVGRIDVFTPAAIDALFEPIGIVSDDTKGFLLVEFPFNLPGARVEIGAESGPSVVLDDQFESQIGDTLLPGDVVVIIFPNVTPGPFEIVAIATGQSCVPISRGLPHVMSARTVVQVKLLCTPDSP
jgi:hypothetical protein